ncbi:hypothetical protein ASPCAL02400 [Aspergillus calidoustus]|uniref:Uncharacterized protein n=1 Tax=Aspergillus calidoustus TaxID=454130 RepID=A0A0U5GSA3_ASPCI|nr:hypothetical protein ASPCAL02400 [Aspergillus calidoustus]
MTATATATTMSFDDVMTCTSIFESFYTYNPFISDRAGDDRDETVLPIYFTTGGLLYKGFYTISVVFAQDIV